METESNQIVSQLVQSAIQIPADKVDNGKKSCELCSQTISGESEKNAHILQHLAHEFCNICEKQLFRIGDALFVLHTTMTCVKQTKCSDEVEPLTANVILKEELNLHSDDERDIFDDYDKDESDSLTAMVEVKVEPLIETEAIFGDSFECNDENSLANEESMRLNDSNEQNSIGIEPSPPKREKRFPCLFCGTKYQNRKSVVRHVRLKHPDESFSNVLERKQSNSPFGLTIDELLKCSHKRCNELVKSSEMPNHMSKHVGPQFVCYLCNAWLKTQNSLREHMKLKHGPCDRVICSVCSLIYENKKALRRHHRMKHPIDPFDNIRAPTSEEIEQHEKLLAERKTKAALNKESTEKKVIAIVSTEMPSKGIPRLNKRTMDPDTYQKLMQEKKAIRRERSNFSKNESAKRVIECKFEGCKQMVKRRNMTYHIQRCHNDPMKCELCDFTGTKRGLERHMKVHDLQRERFECSSCEATFARKKGLKEHEHIVHLKEPKRYMCSFCGQTYRTNASLRTHTYSHTGEKPFGCTYCDKRFRSKLNQKEHERTHTGQRPNKVQCDQAGCDRKFLNVVGLKRHKFVSHGVWTTKFPCQICSTEFPDNRLLKNHLKTHNVEFF